MDDLTNCATLMLIEQWNRHSQVTPARRQHLVIGTITRRRTIDDPLTRANAVDHPAHGRQIRCGKSDRVHAAQLTGKREGGWLSITICLVVNKLGQGAFDHRTVVNNTVLQIAQFNEFINQTFGVRWNAVDALPVDSAQTISLLGGTLAQASGFSDGIAD